MDLRELEYFTVIAQEGNLTHAAERLYVSQPTLSKFLQRLEQENGTPLLQHNGKSMSLTYAGRRYLSYAERMLALKRELDNEMAGIRKQDVGSLRVGMPPFRCSFALPGVLPTFHARHAGVEFQIREDSSAALDEALLKGEIDLAFYNMSESRPGLSYELLREDEIFAILPKGHPIGERAVPGEPGQAPGIRLEWLQDEVLILQSHSQRLGQYIRHELKRKRLEPRRVMQSSNIRAGALLAASGYGAAFLSGDLLRHFESLLEFAHYRLLDCSLPVHFVAAWREGSYLPEYAKEFIELMRQNV